MPRRCLFLLALSILVPRPAVAQSCPTCAPPTIDKKYCHTNVLLVPQQKASTAPDWKLREVEVGRYCSGPLLDFVEEKRVVTEMKLEEREVEEQVVVTESKPVTVTEPCGKCRTEYQPCEVVKTVKVKKFCAVPVQREVVIKVPVLKPGPEVVVKKLQLDKTTVPAIQHRFTAVTTHSENTVTVPLPEVKPPCRDCK